MGVKVDTAFNFSMDNGTILRLFVLMIFVFITYFVIAKLASKF
jgi:hypothetical protein